VLRTADAAVPGAGREHCGNICALIVIYLSVFSFGIYFINRLIARGMSDSDLVDHGPARLATGHAIFEKPPVRP